MEISENAPSGQEMLHVLKVKESLTKKIGRPTCASWTLKARVPMSQITYRKLMERAVVEKVGYTQLAARLLEHSLAQLQNLEQQSCTRAVREPDALPRYIVIAMAATGMGYRETEITEELEKMTEQEWHALFWDITNNPKRTEYM